jgi:hypothetical protein
MVYTTGFFSHTIPVTCHTVPAACTTFTGVVYTHRFYTNTTVYQHRGVPSNYLHIPWILPEVFRQKYLVKYQNNICQKKKPKNTTNLCLRTLIHSGHASYQDGMHGSLQQLQAYLQGFFSPSHRSTEKHESWKEKGGCA